MGNDKGKRKELRGFVTACNTGNIILRRRGREAREKRVEGHGVEEGEGAWGGGGGRGMEWRRGKGEGAWRGGGGRGKGLRWKRKGRHKTKGEVWERDEKEDRKGREVGRKERKEGR